ncbi:hypothetical protein [Neptunomonas antarctica]|uniref:Uncharacterized protein n=1 Tax=Neptunomonas antarctica TaxID=619304 RepID=A0A1N7LQI8_9GAMM|nr:hypothetical protein [Neptunomonas antarctica]SIS76029.1 hypothetical protein SAMN05421760_104244 [Neptunomonas antarctica]
MFAVSKLLIRSLLVVIPFSISSVSGAAEKSSVGLEQMRFASALGASCSGFYDGTYALLHNLEAEGNGESLAVLRNNWPAVSKRYAFRQSTSAMLMTSIFIKQINQRFKPEVAFSLQSFTAEYVKSRKAAMGWQDGQEAGQNMLLQQQQCEHIILISKNNGTLNDALIDSAMEKRSVALGVDLESR